MVETAHRRIAWRIPSFSATCKLSYGCVSRNVKVNSHRKKTKSGCYVLGRFVVPGRTVKRLGPQASYRECPTGNGAGGVASSPPPGEGFHSGAVNRIADANTGANGNSTIVLDHGAERLPVADVRQPIVKAAAKEGIRLFH